jgi:Ca2+-binding EF-hand superfamily protein
MTADELAKALRTIDTNGDGEIDFEEFCQMIHNSFTK